MTNDIINRIDKGNLTFAPSLMTQLSTFPVSKPTTTSIKRSSGSLSIVLTTDHPDHWIYGKTPRLLFLYIQSMIAANSPYVNMRCRAVLFTDNLVDFCKTAGLPYNGEILDDVKQTILNLNKVSILIDRDVKQNGLEFQASRAKRIADDALVSNDPNDGWAFIIFTQSFWDELCATCVPMDREIIKKLGKSPRTIDLYLWFRYRLNALQKLHRDILVPWGSLYLQFEGTELPMKEFKRKFKNSAKKLVEVCPTYVIRCDSKGVTIPYRDNKMNWGDVSDRDLVNVDTSNASDPYVDDPAHEQFSQEDLNQAFQRAVRAVGLDRRLN